MEKNELRIGNWVNAYHGNVQIVSIGNEIVTTQNLIGATHGAILSPIKITPEILEKAGFKYSASFGQCKYEKSELEIDENFNPLVEFAGEFIYYGKRIEYLHQLQNLYFALTGEEFILNSI